MRAVRTLGGGYIHIPFVNVLDPMDVAAFFGSSPCAAVNDKDLNEREAACNNVTSAGQFGCLYDPNVQMCQPMKNAYRQVLKDRIRTKQDSVPQIVDDLGLTASSKRTPNIHAMIEDLKYEVALYLKSAAADERITRRVRLLQDFILANDLLSADALVGELQELALETKDRKSLDGIVTKALNLLYLR